MSYDLEKEHCKKIVQKTILSYLPLIEYEYSIKKEEIKNIATNIDNIIEYSEDTISFFIRDGVLYLPAVFPLFEKLKKHKNYNTCKDTGVPSDKYLNTDATYTDYINHVINDGLDVIDYYKESLLHETMHLCGGRGYTPLEEGINELKTRQLAQMYDIKIAAVGYQKEVEIAQELEKILGNYTMNQIAFMNNREINDYLNFYHTEEEINLYNEVRHTMNVEGYEYYTKVSSIENPFEKAKLYDSIEYKKTKAIINNYYNQNSKEGRS